MCFNAPSTVIILLTFLCSYAIPQVRGPPKLTARSQQFTNHPPCVYETTVRQLFHFCNDLLLLAHARHGQYNVRRRSQDSGAGGRAGLAALTRLTGRGADGAVVHVEVYNVHRTNITGRERRR